MKKNTKNNGCPYHENRNNKCTHKYTFGNCIYKDGKSCQYYKEWIQIVESIQRMEKDAPEPVKKPHRSLCRRR